MLYSIYSRKGLLALLLTLSTSFVAISQINTPASVGGGPVWPFGSRIQTFPAPYDFGLVPTNLPAGAYNPASNQYGKSQDAYTAYNQWKACYAVSCGAGTPTRWRIKYDNANQTVSEGIGYGMLLAAYAADKTLFDGLWAYYKDNIVAGLGAVMGWHRTGCANGSVNPPGTDNGATDSELDAAMALIVAECQWPTATTPYNYSVEANTLLGQIRQVEMNDFPCGARPRYLATSGDGFQSGCNDCYNPSYQSPGYYRLFQTYDAGAPANFWTTNAPNASYTMLNANRNATTGLVSNWCNGAGTPNTCNPPAFNDHGYDAGRNPWRMAVDYVWHGTAAARTNFCQPLSNYIYTQTTNLTNAANLRGPVTQAGAYIGGRTTATPDAYFTAVWGAGAMGVNAGGNNQNVLNYMYTRVLATAQGNFTTDCNSTTQSFYFGNTLRVLSLFLMTGNFWEPCPPKCQKPEFGQDSISTCAGTPLTLNSNLTAASRTFAWFRDGVNLGLTTPSISATTTGKYWVVMDSVGYACQRTDTIYVVNTLPTPKLGADINLCKPATATLNANVFGNPTPYTYQWAYTPTSNPANLADILYQGNAQTYLATKPGLYRVTVSAGACVAKSDIISITSAVAIPDDTCRATSGVVNLRVTNTVPPNTSYEWYAAATGGAPLATGILYQPSIAATTTYWVQDNSTGPGKMGLPNPLYPNYQNTACNALGANAGQDVATNATYSMAFTTSKNNITIDSITIYHCLYGAGALSMSFQLKDAAGTNIGAALGATPGTILYPVGETAATWFAPPWNTSGRVTGVRYRVGPASLLIATAGNYRLAFAAGSSGGVFWENTAGISYPYSDNIDGATASITGTYYNGSIVAGRYGAFYDWRILAPKTCDRVPVTGYISGSCNTILPAELLEFNATMYHTYTRLAWATASEKDVNYFIVQRSLDGITYSSVSTVKAVGNSSTVQYYSYNDYLVPESGAYYRIVTHDLDGADHFSDAIYIKPLAASGLVKIHPNPAQTEITVRSLVEDEVIGTITITDVMGKDLATYTAHAVETQIDISTLTDGVYFVKVNFGHDAEIVRLVKK